MTRTGQRDHKLSPTARSRGLSWYYKSTSESLVSTRWSSSERPLFVRTVWVGSIRHAILSWDDPLLSRPSSRKLSSANVTSIASDDATSSETSSTSQVPLEDYLERSHFGDDVDGDTARTKGKRKKMKKKYWCHAVHKPEPEDNLAQNIDSTNAFDSATPETSFFLGEESRNALSERVFQWLDLANKAAATGAKSRTSTKRINTASYYLEPPNYQRHKRLLPKILPLVTDSSPSTEIEIEEDVTPRRSSFQEAASGYTNKCDRSANECCPEAMKRRRSTSSTIHNRCQNPDIAPADVNSPNTNQRVIEPRPVTAWTRASTGIPSRPQLHIFMPNLPPHAKAPSFDGSDCGLNND
ncbi:hypothetical protein LSTR_LSTR012200 [Laodelphax striatellus]|uniref:Uncharacterized protein n=1 Tax=Laodelphax striatellus TaxID=195883 RepID=A0A482XUB4_LAOST|nr:hypothetical protein LSTR_LSTR012200 [Laodelphax striatellus]